MQDDIQKSNQDYNAMEGKSSSQMAEWEAKPKRRINYQQNAGKGSAALNPGLNYYTGIGSRAPALDFPTMSIPELEKSRNPDKLDDPPSLVGPD